MVDPAAGNRALWEKWADLHADSDFYDVQAFRNGATSLKEIELAELGDVAGKSLLHLQCHFGLDTLSWARRGARVTGVDFSQNAIDVARQLADETNIDARFIAAPIQNMADIDVATFDIVFTSYGVLVWLPDLSEWAEIIARHLKQGGTFYMVEFHPLLESLDDEGRRFVHPYFDDGEGYTWTAKESYAGVRHEPIETRQWAHPISKVVTALLDAGLMLRFLHEFPFSPYRCYPFLESETDATTDRYIIGGMAARLPLVYSVMATKP